MYIWNINALIAALRGDSFTEKQKKNYRSVFWILAAITVLSSPIVYDFSTMNKIDMIDFFCFILINGIGYFLIYVLLPYQSLEETNLMDLTISIIVEVVYNLMFIHYFKKIYR